MYSCRWPFRLLWLEIHAIINNYISRCLNHTIDKYYFAWTGSEGLCGTSLKTVDYTTDQDNFMPIEFTTDGSNQVGSFEITLTNFHTGEFIKECVF